MIVRALFIFLLAVSPSFGQSTLVTAEQFFSDWNTESCYNLFSEPFKKQVSKEKLQGILSNLEVEHGTVQSFQITDYSYKGVNDYVFGNCIHSLDTVRYKLVINRYTGLINGFFKVASSEKPSYQLPDWLSDNQVEDSVFTFQSDGLDFVAKSTFASSKALTSKRIGKNSEYTIIILSGSGPTRMNGELYENQVYTELAVGLSQLGYNCVRFNKRSSFNVNTENLRTIEDEYIKDATALIKTLKNNGHSKFIVLGHSLGGYVGGELLSDKQLGIVGFIALCAPISNTLDLLLDQNKRLSEGLNQQKLQSDVDFLRGNQSDEFPDSLVLGAPVSYWKSLDGFSLESSLNKADQNILVLHGGHDFQVPISEHEGWKKQFKKDSRFTFKLLCRMNHLLVEQPKDDNPNYYKKKQGISPRLLRKMRRWLKKL